MPRLRSKRTAAQRKSLEDGRNKRLSIIMERQQMDAQYPFVADEVEVSISEHVTPSPPSSSSSSHVPFADDLDESDVEFMCEMGEEQYSAMLEHDQDDDYYSDSGNEEDAYHVLPHGLAYRRKHCMVFEIVDGQIEFLPYNGDPSGVYQIAGVLYTENGVHTKMTIGATTKIRLSEWASAARSQGLYGIRNPRVTRTRGCRSVRYCELTTDGMNTKSSFPFTLFGRTLVMANLLKGIVRRIVQPEFFYNFPDCTGGFVQHYAYIFRKVLDASAYMPVAYDIPIERYIDQKGFRIVNGLTVVPK